jgi:phosphoribosylformimino-5-aminoimidazole carboxamide ribotide isomerase
VEVIPALDLRAGRVVRLLQGDFGRETTYAGDGIDIARRYAEAGARRLHVVDLDAARGSGDNRALVERMTADAGVEVQVAGGVRSLEAAQRWLAGGAASVVMGTVAVRQPERLAEIASALPGRVLAALDVRAGRPAVTGWTAVEDASVRGALASWSRAPLAGVIVTSVDRDGTLGGPDLALLREALAASPWPVTYSGGVAGIEDVRVVAETGAASVILGKALLEGRMALADALRAARSVG